MKLGVAASQFSNPYNSDADYNAVTSFQRAIDYSPAAGPLDKAQNRHLVNETVGTTTTSTAYGVNPDSHRYDGWRAPYYVPVEGEHSLSSNLSRTGSGDSRRRYLVPRERLDRIYCPLQKIDQVF